MKRPLLILLALGAAAQESNPARQAAAGHAEVQNAGQAAHRSEPEKARLRERLRQQLNTILETCETARGLIIDFNDAQFDVNRATLKPAAREKLAKVSGILLAYPGLKVRLEGHADNVGTSEYDLKLSRERADAVRDYLVAQGVPASNLSVAGRGESGPVASNDTAAARLQNRRLEMVVAGEPIGVETAQPATGTGTLRPQK